MEVAHTPSFGDKVAVWLRLWCGLARLFGPPPNGMGKYQNCTLRTHLARLGGGRIFLHCGLVARGAAPSFDIQATEPLELSNSRALAAGRALHPQISPGRRLPAHTVPPTSSATPTLIHQHRESPTTGSLPSLLPKLSRTALIVRSSSARFPPGPWHPASPSPERSGVGRSIPHSQPHPGAGSSDSKECSRAFGLRGMGMAVLEKEVRRPICCRVSAGPPCHSRHPRRRSGDGSPGRCCTCRKRVRSKPLPSDVCCLIVLPSSFPFMDWHFICVCVSVLQGGPVEHSAGMGKM